MSSDRTRSLKVRNSVSSVRGECLSSDGVVTDPEARLTDHWPSSLQACPPKHAAGPTHWRVPDETVIVMPLKKDATPFVRSLRRDGHGHKAKRQTPTRHQAPFHIHFLSSQSHGHDLASILRLMAGAFGSAVQTSMPAP